jgi:hypothetical protein
VFYRIEDPHLHAAQLYRQGGPGDLGGGS